MSQSKTVHLALLRGINVGGKNKLPMKDLCALFVDAGCSDVHSYIQSGNVIFTIAGPEISAVTETVSVGIKNKFELEVQVLMRTREELLEVLRINPFLEHEESQLHVMFLRDKPTNDAIAELDPDRSPGDKYRVIGREVFLCLNNGMATTKITNAYLDKKLRTVSTARNWRTVKALAEQMSV